MSEVKKCNCDNGWWCPGCGGFGKSVSLKAIGLSDDDINMVIDMQFAGCEEPLVHCYCCNRDGSRNQKPEEECDVEFWKDVVL